MLQQVIDMRTDVLGVGFDSVTMEEATERAYALATTEGFKYIVTPNPEIVWMCRKDGNLRRIIDGAALVVPDGIGIIYGAKILKRPLKEKVGGADLALKLFERMAQDGRSVFLFGAKPGIADTAAEKLAARYPGLKIAGTADGYFQDDEPIMDKINAAAPDVLLVCLGAPKQEEWIDRHKDRLNVHLAMGLGGSLDVYAGVAKRAPKLMLKLNLEWLYRLVKQPSRLGRQMRLPAFLFAVIGQRIREMFAK